MEITIRFAEPKDAPLFTSWVKEIQELNLFDPTVMSYPTTNLLAVDKDGEPILYMPFQAVICGESLAPKPGLSKREEAIALKRVHEGLTNIAKGTGVREIVFVCKDESFAQFITHYGYEELPYKLFRFKVPALTAEELETGQFNNNVKKVQKQ